MTSVEMKKPLEDVQAYSDVRGLDIDEVGIWDLRYPVSITLGDVQIQGAGVYALTAQLPASQKGTHMSRMVAYVDHLSKGFIWDSASGEDLRTLLHTEVAVLRVDTHVFLEKRSPCSRQLSCLSYPLRLSIRYASGKLPEHVLKLTVAVKSLCPASKLISTYGAHSQRAEITVHLKISHPEAFSLKKTIQALEGCGSTELFSLLKREDEKWVTEHAYDNPKFVEDIVRDAALVCQSLSGVDGFQVCVENFESIHQHSVHARITRGLDWTGE